MALVQPFGSPAPGAADAGFSLVSHTLSTSKLGAFIHLYGWLQGRQGGDGVSPRVHELVAALNADTRLSPPSCTWKINMNCDSTYQVPEAASAPSVCFSLGPMEHFTAWRVGGTAAAAAPTPSQPPAGKPVAKEVSKPAPAPTPSKSPSGTCA